MMSILRGKLRRVWKFFQCWIVSGRLEIFQCETENWIQPITRVPHIKIERGELVTEMQFRIVIERTAHVVAQLLFDRPLNHVAHRVKIKMKIERDWIIEPDHFVVKRIALNQTKAERNDAPIDSPNEKTNAIRHLARDTEKEIAAQVFKFHRRTFVNLQIERENLVDDDCWIGQHFHVDLRVALGLSEFSAQTFATGVAQLR